MKTADLSKDGPFTLEVPLNGCRLVTTATVEGFTRKYHVTKQWVRATEEGVVQESSDRIEWTIAKEIE